MPCNAKENATQPALTDGNGREEQAAKEWKRREERTPGEYEAKSGKRNEAREAKGQVENPVANCVCCTFDCGGLLLIAAACFLLAAALLTQTKTKPDVAGCRLFLTG